MYISFYIKLFGGIYEKNSKNKEKLKIANNIKKEVNEFKNFISRGKLKSRTLLFFILSNPLFSKGFNLHKFK